MSRSAKQYCRECLIRIWQYKKMCLNGSFEGWQVGNVPYIGGQRVPFARSINRESSVSKNFSWCEGYRTQSSLLNKADDVLVMTRSVLLLVHRWFSIFRNDTIRYDFPEKIAILMRFGFFSTFFSDFFIFQPNNKTCMLLAIIQVAICSILLQSRSFVNCYLNILRNRY